MVKTIKLITSNHSNLVIQIILVLIITHIKVNAQIETLTNKNCPFVIVNETELKVKLEGEQPVHSKISPDGKKILLTTRNYKKISVYDFETKDLEILSKEYGNGFSANWHAQSNSKVNYQSFNPALPKKGTYVIKGLGKDNHWSNQGEKYSETFDINVRINLETKMVEAYSKSSGKKWNVTQNEGIYYSMLISPDGNKVLIHKNDGRMYIYDLYGKGLLAELGNGLCNSWSPDGKYLIYSISSELGGDVIAISDLYICKSDGSAKWKLTDTDDKIELWPYWSQKANMISYYEQNRDEIIIAELKSNL